MKKKNTYRLIKGSRQRDFIGSMSSLWLADDHLLLVRNSGWKESYRKFYFADIQGLIIAKTKQRRNQTILLLLFTLFFLGLAALSGEIGRMILGSMAVLLLLVLSVNWFKGATCRAQIITAVQSTSLPCNRFPVAKRLKETLTTSITKVQGSFDAAHSEKLITTLQKISEEKKATASSSRKGDSQEQQFTLFFDKRAHILTYTLFLVLAGISAVSLGGREQLLYTTESILFGLTLITIIVALYRQSRSKITGILSSLTWIASIILVIGIVLNFGLIAAAMQQTNDIPAMLNNEYKLWMMLGQVQPEDSLYLRVLLTSRVVCFTLLGILGLLFTRKANNTKADA
ncbi:MAG: hypothetical protein Q3M24_02970 [Candidatus Electrothrix aestuarii]|uniref:Uncharacterized protein n=1 Tax=Candidatus Electrothrix aestuarii TaxID=3062594 RepID=A0AAU8LWR9_9BACT|nr:hypothetical protein [Candidatus Electrothrix aestuarii]